MRRSAVLAGAGAVLLSSAMGAAATAGTAATHAKPALTANEATFTIPAGATGSWRLRLFKIGMPQTLLGHVTRGTGTLTLTVPQTATCDFQADVTVRPPGAPRWFFYSGIRELVPDCGQHVYWTSIVGNFTGYGSIWKANLDGSHPHVILRHVQSPVGLAVQGSHIYWVTGHATIWQASLDGSGERILVSGQHNTNGLAANDSHIYWTVLQAGTIMWADPNSGQVLQLLGHLRQPWGVAVNSSHIYWASVLLGAIKQASLNGQNVQTLVEGQHQPIDVAVGPQ